MQYPSRIALGLAAAAALSWPAAAEGPSRAEVDALIASHAATNKVPEALVRRVVMKESRFNPGVVGRGGAMGLMQIKYSTARSLGYRGEASGLLDPDTNLTYGVRYLAGAYRAAGGNGDRAWSYYRTGYYYHAKSGRVVQAGRPPAAAVTPFTPIQSLFSAGR